MKPRAVITGVGVVSPFGVGTERFWDALAAGASAVGPIRSFDASCFPTRVAGEVPVAHTSAAWMREHQPESAHAESFSAWEGQGMLRDRKVAFGVLAALEAWRSAGCE
ncbi:MAG TPA: beta-ketoacyl synthase N-terminal-like domain-containing protein, partial [Polyangiaceae bacterium]